MHPSFPVTVSLCVSVGDLHVCVRPLACVPRRTPRSSASDHKTVVNVRTSWHTGKPGVRGEAGTTQKCETFKAEGGHTERLLLTVRDDTSKNNFKKLDSGRAQKQRQHDKLTHHDDQDGSRKNHVVLHIILFGRFKKVRSLSLFIC